jgi:antitoxin (DNA-binding transcriptional repressor) of toxin-antitoxin stability system
VTRVKTFTYSQTRQRLSAVLDLARREEVLITRRGGDTFSLTCKRSRRSPFDVPPVKTPATTRDILTAVRESRTRASTSLARARGADRP